MTKEKYCLPPMDQELRPVYEEMLNKEVLVLNPYNRTTYKAIVTEVIDSEYLMVKDGNWENKVSIYHIRSLENDTIV